ncbi:hypothetical protein [Flammeovirga kamogawensis]|uniref:DUF5689 domain-containing protein n=1 Tax=Flammeovirga kamogawensis TaxID=373891 RepID=A0ABX8GQJ5_9BACT|nr:hypothetical protein [Flammeovirga kamogawensis]MBB6462101.1 hypothetical protein [Flammeovirga kamogawensis]QWG05835.1 hypothetical protein KM029_10635 [Flammeovirga kamogawensis]TRX67660.1 hypothetical protein EO216_05650 [Flammeovirga kamogawensis]
MKIKFLLFVCAAFMFTSCSDAIDDALNDAIDSIVSYGDATANVDGASKDFSNYAGFRTSDNITSIYFTDISFSVTNPDVKGDAILAFIHSDLVSTSQDIDISLSNAASLALNPKMALIGALYLENVNASDIADLITEYNKNQDLIAVAALAEQKDVNLHRTTLADIVGNVDANGYIRFNFSNVSDDKLSGTFSFKAYGEDNNKEITEGSFTDTPKDLTDL